jgi:uncharacterized Ntn-hydrolase superfamily protein
LKERKGRVFFHEPNRTLRQYPKQTAIVSKAYAYTQQDASKILDINPFKSGIPLEPLLYKSFLYITSNNRSMKTIRHLFFSMLLLTVLHLPSFATWSIIVVDPKTKEIGIAGASCTVSVYGIGLIVPGKGAIVVQAMSNSLARLQGFNMIRDGATPAAILAKIRHPDYDPEQQQYAVLCMNDIKHPATYTGTKTTSYGGTLTGNGISVQGNTLTHPEELQAIFDAAVKAQKEGLSIQDVLMLALEAGAKAGGDKRCGERKASSAFLTVSKAGDVEKHWLNLVVYGNDDHTHAVEALRHKFDDWKAQQQTNGAKN